MEITYTWSIHFLREEVDKNRGGIVVYCMYYSYRRVSLICSAQTACGHKRRTSCYGVNDRI
jgi:hypothetical protein